MGVVGPEIDKKIRRKVLPEFLLAVLFPRIDTIGIRVQELESVVPHLPRVDEGKVFFIRDVILHPAERHEKKIVLVVQETVVAEIDFLLLHRGMREFDLHDSHYSPLLIIKKLYCTFYLQNVQNEFSIV